MKKTVAVILAALLTVSLVSCHKSKQPQNTDVDNNETINQVEPGDNSEDPSEDKPEADKPAEQPAEKTAEITYNGRVDMNFIEVSFAEGEYGIMKLSEELKDSFDSLGIAEGAKLTVTYTEKDGQKIITGIKK